MYLQLAENSTPALQPGEPSNPYIFIPDVTGQSAGLQVREDYFDVLTDAEFKAMMKVLAPLQPEVGVTLTEGQFLASRGKRRQRREAKKQAKVEKKEKKQEIKQANKDRRAKTIANLVQTVGGVASNIFGKKAPDLTTTGYDPGEPEPEPDPEPEPEKKPWFKRPIVLIGGALLIGGVIYMATRKRKK